MNIQPAKSRRTPTSTVVVADDLIAEVLSFLPVKSLLQFRCVSKSWKTLISDSAFVKLHLSKYQEYWFRLWNLASRRSPIFGYFHTVRCRGSYIFKFGCDNSSGTYKLLAFWEKNNQPKSSVIILSLSDDVVWRGIESFLALPLCSANGGCHTAGVYCSGTFNWLTIHNDINGYDFEYITVEQLIIVSLDLGTETYSQYKLPSVFDELPPAAPIVGVLGGYLCFSYSYKHTYFVIWQMKKFGAEDSWSQFLKISYQRLFEDAATLILRSRQENEAILYNWRDNKVRRTNITASKHITNNYRTSNQVSWSSTSDYIESFVSIF